MYGAGGLSLSWSKLDTRFPTKPKMDEKGEVLDLIFSLSPSGSELTKSVLNNSNRGLMPYYRGTGLLKIHY